MSSMYAEIAVDNASYSFDKPYSYAVAKELEDTIRRGCRVLVPFGKGAKPRIGIVLNLTDKKPETQKIKNIISLVDREPLLNEEMMSLALWMSERTFCTVFDAVKAILPCGIHYKMKVQYMSSLSGNIGEENSLDEDEKQVLSYLSNKSKFVDREKILSALGFSDESSVLERLYKKQLVVRNYDTQRRVGDASEKMIKLCDSYENGSFDGKLTKKQQSVISLLLDAGTASLKEVCCFCAVTAAVPKSLVGKGIAEIYDSEIMRLPFKSEDGVMSEIKLSDVQNNVYEKMKKLYREQTKGDVCLLYGVTGSGKTQVYLRLIDDVINDGKSVIIMVPEISLTPQTIRIFKERYGKKIAVFHSGLSMGERVDEFKRVKNKEVQIAIGTRSAVFAPLENIGLIIMDEEQEHTYKSESKPRYHARDVAKFRCASNGALLLLASATPSVETFANAKSGRYKMFRLDERYGTASLPEIITVNLNDEQSNGERSFISKRLLDELKINIENKEQSIILLNRRGYNTFVACKKCGNVVTCPNCSISMTYHSVSNKLMCHYCGYTTVMAEKCEDCGSENIRYSGVGTQRIEADLKALIPQARVLRVDADTTMSRMAFENNFETFRKGEYDIMVGTQMVAKGLDFENVTLVGVVSADQQLYNDDYRSTERTFSLLTQVVGRSGRGRKKGRAVIQTYTPDNETIRFAKEQDYDAFFDYEIRVRKMMTYPPYCDLCVVGFVGEDEIKTKSASHMFFSLLKKSLSEEYSDIKLIALGPVALKVAKVGNKYRYRLILKCHNTKHFRKMMSELLIKFDKEKLYSDITVYADINPENML